MKIVITEDIELVITTGDHEKHECVLKTNEGKIHALRWLNIKAIDKDTVVIDDTEYKIDTLTISSMTSVSEDFIKADSIYLKSLEDCLPDEEDGYPLLYKVAIRAMKMSKAVPLTQTQHNRKLASIRELIKIGNGKKASMSQPKLLELLSFYGLELKDLLREEYL